jgi:transcriptional regulator with XRE-family HTH domain
MENSRDIFTANLRRLRKSKKLSQDALAQLLGITLNGFQKYESGESFPPPERLDALARALSVEPWELVKSTASLDVSGGLMVAANLLAAYERAPQRIRDIVDYVLTQKESRIPMSILKLMFTYAGDWIPVNADLERGQSQTSAKSSAG